MAVQGVNGAAVLAVGAGAVLLWSGITGAKLTTALRSLLSGQQPSSTNVNPVQTAAASAGATGVGPGAASPFGGVSAGTTPASGSETSFYSAMLQNLGAPANSANLMSCYAWGRHEEPGFPPQNVGGFAWNPLNIKGSGGGFAQYPSATAGAAATAQFLLSNNYGNIVAAFRSGKGLCGNPSVASDLSRWSGGGGAVPPSQGYASVC